MSHRKRNSATARARRQQQRSARAGVDVHPAAFVIHAGGQAWPPTDAAAAPIGYALALEHCLERHLIPTPEERP